MTYILDATKGIVRTDSSSWKRHNLACDGDPIIAPMSWYCTKRIITITSNECCMKPAIVHCSRYCMAPSLAGTAAAVAAWCVDHDPRA